MFAPGADASVTTESIFTTATYSAAGAIPEAAAASYTLARTKDQIGDRRESDARRSNR